MSKNIAMSHARRSRQAQHRLTQAELIARLSRGLRPKLARDQRLDLGLCHIFSLDDIAKGQGTAQAIWDWVANVLTWSHASEALRHEVPAMQAQLGLCLGLIDRYRRTGRVAFTGPEYQLAKEGVCLMDELAERVDRPTALAAATWSEHRLAELHRQAHPLEATA